MIHPTAQIAEGANIAKDAQIGPFCSVPKGVTLESGVILEPHVRIESGVTLGKDSHIHAFAHIGNGKIAVSIGDHCAIREFSTIGVLTTDDQPIVISPFCYIMGYVDIRSGVEIQTGCTITNNVLLDRNSKCQESVIVAAKATVAEHCTIGSGAMVGGASAVQSDIPPYCLAEGYPHAFIRGLNLVGMRRKFEERESITQVKKAFMHLRRKGFSSLEAKDMLSAAKDIYAKQLVAFVATHKV